MYLQSCKSILSVLAAWLHEMDVAKDEEVVKQTLGLHKSELKQGVNIGHENVGPVGPSSGLSAKFLAQIDSLRERYSEDIRQHLM